MSGNALVAKAGLMQVAAVALFVVLAAMVPVDAYAAGLGSAKSFLDSVASTLTMAGVAVLTIAVCWCGYKIVFKGASFSEVAMVLVGGLLIGGAATIASWIFGAMN